MANVYGQTLLDDTVHQRGLPMSLVKQAAKEIIAVIREGLIQDGVVTVSNFGTFRLKTVAERNGFNPNTKERIVIPAHRRVIFTPCKALRELIQPDHHPVIPVAANVSSYRAAAKHAPIAPTPPTKHIEPDSVSSEPEQAQPAAVESAYVPPRTEDAAAQPTAGGAGTTEAASEPTGFAYTAGVTTAEMAPEPEIETHDSQNAVSESGPDELVPGEAAGVDEVEPELEEAMPQAPTVQVAPEHESVMALPEEEGKGDIDLPLAEGPAAFSAAGDERGSQKKRYVLGAAALLVIAVVSLALLRSPEEAGNNIDNSAAVQQPAPAAPDLASLEYPAGPSRENELAPEQPSSEPEAVAATEPEPLAQGEEPPSVEAVAEDLSEVLAAQNAAAVSQPEVVLDEAVSMSEAESDAPEDAIAPQVTAPTEVAAPEATPAQTTPEGGFYFAEQPHKIARGESLWRLARQHYNDPLLWPHIYQANAALIDNPDQLQIGANIVLPSLQGSPEQLTLSDRRNIAEGYYLTYLHYKQTGHKDAFFALLEAKRYDNKVVDEHRSLLKLSKLEEIMLSQQETMPF